MKVFEQENLSNPASRGNSGIYQTDNFNSTITDSVLINDQSLNNGLNSTELNQSLMSAMDNSVSMNQSTFASSSSVVNLFSRKFLKQQQSIEQSADGLSFAKEDLKILFFKRNRTLIISSFVFYVLFSLNTVMCFKYFAIMLITDKCTLNWTTARNYLLIFTPLFFLFMIAEFFLKQKFSIQLNQNFHSEIVTLHPHLYNLSI